MSSLESQEHTAALEENRLTSWEEDPRFDDSADARIETNYMGGELTEIEDRLKTVILLRHEARKERMIKETPEEDDTRFLRRHWLGYHEKNPSPYAPTLGIEIEIRENTLPIPKELQDSLDALAMSEEELENWLIQRRKVVEPLLSKFQKTEELGVPRRKDKFWEFAHNPVRYYHTLSREVQALIWMGLINKEDQKHPLHLTIGGITSKYYGSIGKEAFILARALEATMWSVRGRRLLRPYFSKKFAWTTKGSSGGLIERWPHELQLGTERAVEIRTFQLQTITGLDRMLRSAYLLGAALKAYQEQAQNLPDSGAGKQHALSEVWTAFSHKTAKIFTQFGLTHPGDIWNQPEPSDKSQQCDFVPFAKLMDDAEANPKSRGAKFVREIRKLIIETRAKVAKIIYPRGK